MSSLVSALFCGYLFGMANERQQINVRVDDAWLEALDAWIAAQPVPPSRSQVVMTAVRRFIEDNPPPVPKAPRSAK